MSTQDKPCLHCDIVAMINERYPHGVDKLDAHEILCKLAGVAGDILAHGDNTSMLGFFDIVALVRLTEPGKVNYVVREMN